MAATTTDRTVVAIVTVGAVARLLLSNELSAAKYIFQTAHLLAPLAPHQSERVNLGTGAIWIEMGMVKGANR